MNVKPFQTPTVVKFKEIEAGTKFVLPHLPGFLCGKLDSRHYVVLQGPQVDGSRIRVFSPTKTRVRPVNS